MLEIKPGSLAPEKRWRRATRVIIWISIAIWALIGSYFRFGAGP